MRVAFGSLGCKLNQAEIEDLARQFADAGYRIVSQSEPADVYVLNTCTVTQTADNKSRHLLRAMRRRNPGGVLIATGCGAGPEGPLAALSPDIIFFGNGRKAEILKHVKARLDVKSSRKEGQRLLDGARTRSFIEIQTGCTSFCSYCVVPIARGPEASVPASKVIASIRRRVEEGFREVVLTGTRVGAYLDDGLNLTGLLKRVLAESEVSRIRLSSLQPREVSGELLSLWRDPRLCPHFHFSLQSGSDAVLSRMGRRYCTNGYESTVSMVRESVPDAAITTDIIVGFPGETAEEFEQSLDFCRRMDFARIHVFPFSARPGTAAAGMSSQVSEKVKKERAGAMLALAKEAARHFQLRFMERTMPVLFETQSGGIWSGYTGNYIKVSAKSGLVLANQIRQVRLADLAGGGVAGMVTD